MSQNTTKTYFAVPQNLGGVYGRWGYYKDPAKAGCDCSLSELNDVNLEDLENGEFLCYDAGQQKWVNCPLPVPQDLCLNDLCDVCYLPAPAGPPLEGEFLRWNDTSMCWENTSLEICPDVLAGDFDYYRLGARLIIPGQPAQDIPTIIDPGLTSFKIPLANTTPGPPGTGMNNFFVRGSLITTIKNLANLSLDPLWTNIGPINPAIVTPDLLTIQENNASPFISIPPNKCFRVKFHCLNNPQLKAGRLDDGLLGMVFRLQGINFIQGARDPTPNPSLGTWYFQKAAPQAQDEQPSYFVVTETGSYSYSSNELIMTNTSASASYYRLQTIHFQGLRFLATSNTTLEGIEVEELFEVEPFFYLTSEEIKVQ